MKKFSLKNKETNQRPCLVQKTLEMLPVAMLAAAIMHTGLSSACSQGVTIDHIYDSEIKETYGMATLNTTFVEVIPSFNSIVYKIENSDEMENWDEKTNRVYHSVLDPTSGC